MYIQNIRIINNEIEIFLNNNHIIFTHKIKNKLFLYLHENYKNKLNIQNTIKNFINNTYKCYYNKINNEIIFNDNFFSAILTAANYAICDFLKDNNIENANLDYIENELKKQINFDSSTNNLFDNILDYTENIIKDDTENIIKDLENFFDDFFENNLDVINIKNIILNLKQNAKNNPNIINCNLDNILDDKINNTLNDIKIYYRQKILKIIDDIINNLNNNLDDINNYLSKIISENKFKNKTLNNTENIKSDIKNNLKDRISHIQNYFNNNLVEIILNCDLDNINDYVKNNIENLKNYLDNYIIIDSSTNYIATNDTGNIILKI